jgi:hypothetical protein
MIDLHRTHFCLPLVTFSYRSKKYASRSWEELQFGDLGFIFSLVGTLLAISGLMPYRKMKLIETNLRAFIIKWCSIRGLQSLARPFDSLTTKIKNNAKQHSDKDSRATNWQDYFGAAMDVCSDRATLIFIFILCFLLVIPKFNHLIIGNLNPLVDWISSITQLIPLWAIVLYIVGYFTLFFWWFKSTAAPFFEDKSTFSTLYYSPVKIIATSLIVIGYIPISTGITGRIPDTLHNQLLIFAFVCSYILLLVVYFLFWTFIDSPDHQFKIHPMVVRAWNGLLIVYCSPLIVLGTFKFTGGFIPLNIGFGIFLLIWCSFWAIITFFWIVILIVLTPFRLMDHLAVSWHLKPTLAFAGIILVIIGQIMNRLT